jgi:hypothetical protein
MLGPSFGIAENLVAQTSLGLNASWLWRFHFVFAAPLLHYQARKLNACGELEARSLFYHTILGSRPLFLLHHCIFGPQCS